MRVHSKHHAPEQQTVTAVHLRRCLRETEERLDVLVGGGARPVMAVRGLPRQDEACSKRPPSAARTRLP